ncbi:hypothetical protein DPMN_029866 [Dreissena polymorpha]|uniref:Uncharacterized protein n=1 Tax=Dreissena polymorpha TaxID=45954 RepID=A0A9D4LX79_DREPO|nr:hypothetical protein DPMN_029866 [Dreissena polymorpha]
MVNNTAKVPPIMHLFHEYSLSQSHMMYRDLRLICCTKVCSWLQRRQQDGSSVHKDNTTQRGASPDFDTTRKRWEQKSG